MSIVPTTRTHRIHRAKRAWLFSGVVFMCVPRRRDDDLS